MIARTPTAFDNIAAMIDGWQAMEERKSDIIELALFARTSEKFNQARQDVVVICESLFGKKNARQAAKSLMQMNEAKRKRALAAPWEIASIEGTSLIGKAAMAVGKFQVGDLSPKQQERLGDLQETLQRYSADEIAYSGAHTSSTKARRSRNIDTKNINDLTVLSSVVAGAASQAWNEMNKSLPGPFTDLGEITPVAVQNGIETIKRRYREELPKQLEQLTQTSAANADPDKLAAVIKTVTGLEAKTLAADPFSKTMLGRVKTTLETWRDTSREEAVPARTPTRTTTLAPALTGPTQER